jgi:hypothetical protein
MITAALTTLGILVGILLFVVILCVGLIEIVRSIAGGVTKKKKKTEQNS